jgi:hypothetical protein
MPDRDPLQSLWRSAKEEVFSMTPAALHARAAKLQRRVRIRNAIEYAAAIFVIGVFLYIAIITPALILQLGAVLVAVAAAYVGWRLHVLGRAASDAEMSAASASWADFYRAELQRQREALANVPAWYLGPFAPGVFIFVLGTGFATPGEIPFIARLIVCVVGWTVVAAVFVAIGWLNAHTAKALQREIDALDRAREA